MPQRGREHGEPKLPPAGVVVFAVVGPDRALLDPREQRIIRNCIDLPDGVEAGPVMFPSAKSEQFQRAAFCDYLGAGEAGAFGGEIFSGTKRRSVAGRAVAAGSQLPGATPAA